MMVNFLESMLLHNLIRPCFVSNALICIYPCVLAQSHTYLLTFFVLSLRIFSKCKWSTVICVMRAWNATHVAIMRLGVRIWVCLVLGEIQRIFGLESHKFAASLQSKSSSREICRISFKDCKSSTNDLVFATQVLVKLTLSEIEFCCKVFRFYQVDSACLWVLERVTITRLVFVIHRIELFRSFNSIA